MEPYRRKLGQAFVVFQGRGGGFAGAGDEKKLGDRVYASIVTVAVLSSAGLLWWSRGTGIQIFVAIIWGILIGWAFLLYLSPNAIKTLFGGVLGIAIPDVATLASSAEKSAKSLEKIVAVLLPSTPDVHVVPLAYWLFLLLVGILCLPAYKR